MLVSQISKLTGRASGLLAKILEINPLFQYAQFKLDFSTAIHVKDSDTFTSTAARAENQAAQKDAQKPSTAVNNLALYSREIEIDDLRKLDATLGGGDQALKLFADRRLGGLAVKLGKEIQAHMLAGTNADSQLLGLSTFVKDASAAGQTAALGFTVAELAAMNKNVSLQLNTTANQDALMEMIEQEMANIPGANAIICNTSLGSRLTTIARRHGASGQSLNSFGIPVATFNSIPIIKLPSDCISQTESDGTNSDCTSLYIARFAEELGVAWSTNSGFYFQDFQDAEGTPSGKARMQFFLNLACERTDALRRLSRIRL